ncbi:hypothetical protein AJ80_05823 [Polytolypa hystricis UAMH7299]|uniref:Uncharacterized protein n=1 Tax=Polytolypa hystricis (strain UAMH7299) TaxID=1447883 RepID=A0A2B7Y0T5_POLH7|nr:hypothetical protein AJ80_05823 [Polytolypa hystricis UAMH7299]
MKLTSILFTLCLSAYSFASPIAEAGPAPTNFKVRAITGPGTTSQISGYLEVIGGDVVVGVNPDAEGEVGTIDPYPKGHLKSSTNPGIGYLFPPSSEGGVYDFRFGGVPKIAGVLYTDFFATSAGCGSHCGGPQLVYDETPEDDQFTGTWLAKPRDEGGYFVKWVKDNGNVPAGYTVVFLMRETV